MNSIIIYFSRKDENYVNGAIKSLEVGNTEIAANIIQKLTGAEMFEIQPIQAYSKNYNECIEQAKADQNRDARPELKYYTESLAQYDTVYLGYPNYWGTMPMVVFTLLEGLDLSYKTIYPFCTHEGSGMGKSESDIKKMCPKADVKKGLAIQGGNVKNSEDDISKWLLK